jgi:Protein of unknown function (DUF4235)
MPNRTDLLVSNLEELQQDLRDLWQSLTRDPAKQARKERAWTVFAGVATAVGSIVARKAAARIWGILTGETAPIVKQPPAPSRGGPSSRAQQPEGETETEAGRTPTAAGA